MSDVQVALLCEDIADKYKHDSIEDVAICLKNARQGKYDWGHEKRGVLTMIIISYWMGLHLERKAIELEKQHEATKMQNKNEIQGVDYEAYKKRQKEEKKKPDPTREETEYQKFRLNYLKNKTKKS